MSGKLQWRHAAALGAMLALGACAGSGDGLPRRHMISSANGHATAAGLEMLRDGGSAVDAAIAAQLVLTLVEPQSSGIGGGAFLLHYRADSRHVAAFDGRETAPGAARADMFLTPSGNPLKFLDAVVGGKSVGVPGVLRMLEAAHRDHGKLDWARLFRPAIALAEDGFEISPRLHRSIGIARHLKDFEPARQYFFTPEGDPKPAGGVLVNPVLADTLRRIAAGGADAFYKGEIARDIVQTVRSAPRNSGQMRVVDLARYRAKKREALCRNYRRWRICTMPPPTSGGVATLQILGMLERFDLASIKPGSVQAVHLISEASRLAYADRAVYLADPDFVRVPVDALLSKTYLGKRAGLISAVRTMGKASAGKPRGISREWGRGDALELPSTSHLGVIDEDGNAVSMTTSIENIFGSRLMTRGFMLNNQMTDFSFHSSNKGRPIANRIAPGKRPRSSMSPTLVFDFDRNLVMSVGSPGGSRIIGYVARALIATLDWKLDLAAAFALPNHVNRNGPIDLERGTPLAEIKPGLEALGHEVRMSRNGSGFHGIRVTPLGFDGAADTRREGVADGD